MAEKEKGDVIQVGPMDPNKKNSPIKEGPPPEAAPGQAETKAICWFNGVQYGPGAFVCSGGRLICCGNDGYWHPSGFC